MNPDRIDRWMTRFGYGVVIFALVYFTLRVVFPDIP